MSTKFTPGPWKVFTSPDGSKVVGIGEEKDGMGICDAGFGLWRHCDEDAIANAHLIAAAPDLYAAVEKALRLVGMPEIEGVVGDIAQDHMISVLNTALAKARGE